MEILRVENVTKTYGTGENMVRALDGVSFSVKKGEFIAIVGHRFGQIHTFAYFRRSGQTYKRQGFMDGKDVYAQNDEQLAIFRRRQVGLIYQFYNLIPVLNVVENITLPVLMDGRKVNKERLEELIETLNLKEGKIICPISCRRPAAKGVHWQGIDKCSFGGACGRTHGNLDSKNSRKLWNF